jgi:hypothetical protein
MYRCLIVFIVLFFSCQQENKSDADYIINKSIEVSGGKYFENSTISFDFRSKHYKAIRSQNKFQYERQFQDSLGVIRDVLKNDGFTRFIDNAVFKVADERAKAYSNSVNSVHYFSILPYGLNDKAVNKTFLGENTIKGKNYYKIKVTFNEDGGGEDFEDVFVYWIHSETYKMDYLAYSYHEDNGVGLRFREAFNERYINNLRFVDFNNYKLKQTNAKLEDLDVLFKNEELRLLSKIELENIKVN